ncbi:MAG: hypothetical protein WA628_24785 [Terriglobales bacterium]
MRTPKLPGASFTLAAAGLLATLLVLPGCSLKVKKSENGEDKKVDIETPVGAIHVSKDAAVRDTGLPSYPGAREKQKGSDGDQNKANVNISSSFFGVKVVAVEFLSDDPPEKVAAFYRDQLKKYGGVLECHTSNRHGDAGDVDVDFGKEGDGKDSKLTCEHDSGSTIELKVGTKDKQHIVSISPLDKGKGTDFALVFVQTRGGNKDTI